MITALLSYYDEPPAALKGCIRSLTKLPVEQLVAVDGAYALYPQGKAASPAASHRAIEAACSHYGIELVHHVPEAVWQGGEVEKRDFMFKLAENHTTGSDWYFVIDADERVDEIDGELNLTGDVAFVLLHEPGKITPIRTFFRAQRGMGVRYNHYTYMVGDRYLWGTLGDPEEPAVDSNVTLQHLDHERPAYRQKPKQEYYRRRDSQKIETFPCHWCRTETRDRIPFIWELRDGAAHGKTVGICDPCRPLGELESKKQLAAVIGSDHVDFSYSV